MNKFGFIAENIKPLGTKQRAFNFGKIFKDSLLTQTEKKNLFTSFGANKPKATKSLTKTKTKSLTKHQKNLKKIGKLMKKGYTMKDSWAIVKGKQTESNTSKKKSIVKPKIVKNVKKEVKGKLLVKQAKSKTEKKLTPAQKRAKKAMKLAHTKYNGDLSKAWKEVKRSEKK